MTTFRIPLPETSAPDAPKRAPRKPKAPKGQRTIQEATLCQCVRAWLAVSVMEGCPAIGADLRITDCGTLADGRVWLTLGAARLGEGSACTVRWLDGRKASELYLNIGPDRSQAHAEQLARQLAILHLAFGTSLRLGNEVRTPWTWREILHLEGLASDIAQDIRLSLLEVQP